MGLFLCRRVVFFWVKRYTREGTVMDLMIPVHVYCIEDRALDPFFFFLLWHIFGFLIRSVFF